MKPFALMSALILGLAACAPAPEPEPVFDPNVDVTPGLNDKEPDTCHAVNFAFYVGKPVADLKLAVAHRAQQVGSFQILAPGALGTQEYDSGRINAHIDAAGTVTRLSCG